MANYKTNEQQLLSYLEEQHSQTKGLYLNQVEIHNYWASGDYKKDMIDTHMTNAQIDFILTNSQTRMKPLMFRMKWLESQINELKSFNY